MAVIISKKWTGKDGYTPFLSVTKSHVHIQYVNVHTPDTYKHTKAERHLHACAILYDCAHQAQIKKKKSMYTVYCNATQTYTHKQTHVKWKHLDTDTWNQKTKKR